MITKTSVCSQKGQLFSPTNTLKGSSTLQNQRQTSKIGKTFQKTQIQIKNQKIDDLLKVYGWRSKIQLPVAKIMFYKVVNRNANQQFATVQVSYQSFPVTLSDLKQICLQNLLYLLKQSFIGFQKLFSVFGSFLISNKMIGLNKNNRCKVWINQNFAINEPIDIEMFKNLSEKQFVKQILSIYQKKSQKNKKIQYLFQQLVHCQTFQETVTLIDIFSRKNEIQIPTSYRPNQIEQRRNNPSKSPIKNVSNMTNHSFIAGSHNKGVPKFLNKSQIGQNPNKSKIIDSRDKSRSVTKNNIRSTTPLAHDRSEKIFYNPLKTGMKNSTGFLNKQGKQFQQKNPNDYSFQIKKQNSSPTNKFKPKIMASSTNSLSYQSGENSSQQKSPISPKDRFKQIDVKKSDLNTTYTNNSAITNRNPCFIQKKLSLFDDQEQRNMLESIVSGDQKPRKSMHSTFDLQKLGKMGKTIGQSYMPQDFHQ